MIVFVVHLAPGTDHEGILSEEIVKETQAQIMTAQEAAAVGFEGMPDDPKLRLIAVTDEHRRWIEAALERAPQVVGFEPQQVDM